MKKTISLLSRILIILYALVGLLFLCYSYTQVDLGLTLSRVNIWQSIQIWFQHIGYFERPLSTNIYLGFLFILFLLYGIMLKLLYDNKITKKELWIVIGVTTVTTVLSYPAFSYDFFNYLFTAKTVLIYHQNPYEVIPLQFIGFDPWLSFMHWTHQPSAYTPFWIIVTLIPYILGFGYFLLLIWNLKIVLAIAYILTAVGIGKILQKENKEYVAVGIAAFALNPLIIIECLISAHNDILMMAIVIWAIVFYKDKKLWLSWFMLSLSVATKLMTIFLIPAFFTKWNRKITLVCMSIGFIAVIFQREVLSWYWVWIMPFVALLPEYKSLLILSTGISLGLLLRYAPFLYFGNWDAPVPMIKMWVTAVPIGIACVLVAIRLYVLRKNSRLMSS